MQRCKLTSREPYKPLDQIRELVEENDEKEIILDVQEADANG